MTQEAEKSKVLKDVIEALSSAGISSEITDVVTSNLLDGNQQSDAPIDNLPLSDNARFIIEKRYLQRDKSGNPYEDADGLFHRVANAVSLGADAPKQQEYAKLYYDLMSSLKFLPNSPTLVNAGTDRGCLSACFVVSPEDNIQSIMKIANDAAMIEKWGGGIGFGLSDLRPKQDKIATTHGQACGPIAVMKLYSAVGATLTQGAFRLGAHMGQLIITHPDIREFIHCKDDDDTLQNFNISVQITDEFMNAVKNDLDIHLVNPRDTGNGPSNDVVSTVNARELWNEITESAWKTGDPGVVFIDRVWETAPNPQMGKIKTSNPCGEEFLENYGNCCLGSINLDLHINDGDFDWESLEHTTRTAVRFLNDVIEVNSFPLPQLRETNLNTRRIGLGVMGWADALVRMGLPYDSQEALDLADKLGEFLNSTAWDESANVASERGPFPEYENSALKEKGMPPVRNSSVITIAPTGTISRIAGCSSGIEPHFAMAWWSNVLWQDHEGASSRLLDAPISITQSLEQELGSEQAVREVLEKIVEDPENAEKIMGDHGINSDVFRTSMRVSAEAHIKMQSIWQKHVTNSVSKTINLPNSATIQDVKDAYMLAWETGCKAVTVYRDGSKSMQVLETGSSKSSDQSDEIDIVKTPRKRPASLTGITDRIRTGHGTMFVTINFDEEGNPFEVFANLGKSGGSDSAYLQAIARLASMSLRAGVEPDQIVDQLRGITDEPAWDGGTLVRSAPDAIAIALNRHISDNTDNDDVAVDTVSVATQIELISSTKKEVNANFQAEQNSIICPDCPSVLINQEGCLSCVDCGYSKCE
ncbi:MAG: adenosylcobalamin-dependent ribonucleoside-diphosphate reductase [SAR202 cluster bacterium]|nr:adenosylcobalamin-dependent ribonucleoside-diphosphate reductase [SAR202 cluster bacterium]